MSVGININGTTERIILDEMCFFGFTMMLLACCHFQCKRYPYKLDTRSTNKYITTKDILHKKTNKVNALYLYRTIKLNEIELRGYEKI